MYSLKDDSHDYEFCFDVGKIIYLYRADCVIVNEQKYSIGIHFAGSGRLDFYFNKNQRRDSIYFDLVEILSDGYKKMIREALVEYELVGFDDKTPTITGKEVVLFEGTLTAGEITEKIMTSPANKCYFIMTEWEYKKGQAVPGLSYERIIRYVKIISIKVYGNGGLEVFKYIA